MVVVLPINLEWCMACYRKPVGRAEYDGKLLIYHIHVYVNFLDCGFFWNHVLNHHGHRRIYVENVTRNDRRSNLRKRDKQSQTNILNNL